MKTSLPLPSCIEPLEARIAPAAVVTYTDIDGDIVRITASTGPLDMNDLTLSGGAAGALRSLDLTAAGFQGANVTFTVTKAPTGDGLAHVGRINAVGVDLGNVTVKGDLAVIDCGDATITTPGLKTLWVRSMGSFGLATQGGGGDLQSDIRGALGALKVNGDIIHAFVNVPEGGIGAITVGGSLVGGATPKSGAVISNGGDVGPVKIGGDVTGGAGAFSGVIQATGGKMGNVTVGGSLRGGSETASGLISSFREMGAVKIGHDVLGGLGLQSGAILANGNILNVTIDGSLLSASSDAGANSASISSGGDLGPVKIGHDVKGGRGNNSGQITANASIASVLIGGSLAGGQGINSGTIFAYEKVGPVQIALDVVGSFGDRSGSIFSQLASVTSVAIGGSMLSAFGLIGSGNTAALITSATGTGPVKIGGDFIVGEISAGPTSSISSVTIGGSLIYGIIESKVNIGAVKIGHDLRGGGIAAGGNVASVSIGGSLVGATNVLSRGIGKDLPLSSIVVGGTLGPVSIGGDMRGGNSSDSAYIEAGRILNVAIGGSIVSGIDENSATDLVHNASIRAWHDVGAITVRGSLVGNVSPEGVSPVIISGLGQDPAATRITTTDLAIRSVTVGGRVELAMVLAGFTPDEAGSAGTNGNASVGSVRVAGDWIGSSVSAGVRDAAGDGFANVDDYVISDSTDAIVARIASIAIGGAVIGSSNPAVFSGFTAQQVGLLKIGAYLAPLTTGSDTAIPLAPYTGNVTLREI
ncbi:MAG: hypothetical protein JWQ44_867 [Chthoniobacter sp.]|nr:hypothetical protein [Chthoniobacter sp.]